MSSGSTTAGRGRQLSGGSSWGQLSGREIAGPISAGRPIDDIRGFELTAPKRECVSLPIAPEIAPEMAPKIPPKTAPKTAPGVGTNRWVAL